MHNVSIVAWLALLATGCDPAAASSDAGTADGARAADAARQIDARPGTVPDGTTSPIPDSGVVAAATCQPARLTYYDVVGSGACEVMDVPAALPAIARAGLTAAIAEPWYGGSFGGPPAEACGECWEITTAHATRTVVVTDLCPIAGNPVCAGGVFHFDLAHTAAVALDYIMAGIIESEAHRVACPVEGNISAVIRDANPGFIRLALASPRIAIHTVEYRGSGNGVASQNPWTAMNRDGGAWAATGDITRGGTGVALRLTSAQGQTVTSSVTVANQGPFPRAVDLGVQVDDLGPPSGAACSFTVPPPYQDGFGGIDQVRWKYTAFNQGAIDEASTSGCISGTCFAASLSAFGGFNFYYPEDFARAGLTRLVVHARSSDAAPIEIKLSGPAGNCTGVPATLGASFSEIDVDLATVCAAVPRLRAIQVQVTRNSAGSVVLDDVSFE